MFHEIQIELAISMSERKEDQLSDSNAGCTCVGWRRRLWDLVRWYKRRQHHSSSWREPMTNNKLSYT